MFGDTPSALGVSTGTVALVREPVAAERDSRNKLS